MKKTIRTMQGKQIDFEELALRNEHVSAVGNMNVNAAGDELEKIEMNVDRTRRGNKAFRRQITKKVFDLPIFDSKKDAEIYNTKLANEYAKMPDVVEPIIEPEVSENIGKSVTQIAPPLSKQTTQKKHKVEEVSDELLQEVLNKPKGGGLASAIARTREINHTPIKSPREQLRASDGVKKI